MMKSLVVLFSLGLVCSVFGQDAPQTTTKSTSSHLSIHLAPLVSISPENDASQAAIKPGPAVCMSLTYRFPAVPWLIASLVLMGEYHPVIYKDSSGSLFSFAGFGQLGVLFDIGPAFSLGAAFGPGYGYGSFLVHSPDNGTSLSVLGEVFGWYRISPLWSLGAQVGAAMMPPAYGSRYFLAADVGYHFPEQAASAAQKPAPQPEQPQPEQPQPRQPQPEQHPRPSWLSLGAGAALDLTTWGDLTGDVSGMSAEIKEDIKPIDIKAFVDLTYLQVSVGYMFVNGGTGTVSLDGSTATMDLTGSLTYISFAAYLKYPFVISRVISVFPLLGIEYKLNLTYKDENGNDLKSSMTKQEQADLNELWIEGGAGMDFAIGSFYIRPEVIIGFKPLSQTDKDTISLAESSSGWTSVSYYYFTVNVNLLFGFKL